jgi:hypothetical protein
VTSDRPADPSLLYDVERLFAATSGGDDDRIRLELWGLLSRTVDADLVVAG